MKKHYFLILLTVVIILLGFTGCKKENEVETPNIYVSLRNTITDDVLSLKWIVENRSKTSSVSFKKGSILNYEIKHTSSGETYANDEEETEDIILEPDEIYKTIIEFANIPSGHYVATFWADWNDDKKSSMTIQFDIENK